MSWTRFGKHWRLQSEGQTVRIIDDSLVIENKNGRQVMDMPIDKDTMLSSTGSIDEVMSLL